MATSMLRHFEKLDDRCWEVASTGSATENQRPMLTIVTKKGWLLSLRLLSL